MSLFQTSSHRYQQAPDHNGYAAISSKKLAFVVGLLALCLPFVMIVGAHYQTFTGPIPGIPPACFRDSISHTYYSPFLGSIFIGTLVFIGGYLLVYQGEDEKGAEKRLSGLAGIAAIGVALFPTSGDGCDDPTFLARPIMAFSQGAGDATALPDVVTPFALFSFADSLHYLSAAILFVFLAWFALFVFTAADPHQKNSDGSLTQTKRIRNALYYAMGAVMIASIGALAVSFVFKPTWWNLYNVTFWVEAAALWAFGLSWMVKGRFLGRWIGD